MNFFLNDSIHRFWFDIIILRRISIHQTPRQPDRVLVFPAQSLIQRFLSAGGGGGSIVTHVLYTVPYMGQSLECVNHSKWAHGGQREKQTASMSRTIISSFRWRICFLYNPEWNTKRSTGCK